MYTFGFKWAGKFTDRMLRNYLEMNESTALVEKHTHAYRYKV